MGDMNERYARMVDELWVKGLQVNDYFPFSDNKIT